MQDNLERISKHKGVKGVLIVGNDGCIHKSTLDVSGSPSAAELVLCSPAGSWSVIVSSTRCPHASCWQLQEHLTQEYASMIPSLTALARSMVRELDPQVSEEGAQACWLCCLQS